MSSAFPIDFLEPTSDNFLISGQKQSVGIHFLSKIARKILVIKLSGFAEIFTFPTLALLVSVLAVIVHIYATSSLKSGAVCERVSRHLLHKNLLSLNCI